MNQLEDRGPVHMSLVPELGQHLHGAVEGEEAPALSLPRLLLVCVCVCVVCVPPNRGTLQLRTGGTGTRVPAGTGDE